MSYGNRLLTLNEEKNIITMLILIRMEHTAPVLSF